MPVVEFEISVLLQSTFITNIYKSVCPSWVAVGRRRSGMRADAAGEPPPRLSGSLTQTEGQIGALNPHRSWQRFLLNALIFTHRRFEKRKKKTKQITGLIWNQGGQNPAGAFPGAKTRHHQEGQRAG